MAISTRLTNTGTLFTNGKFDEITGMIVGNNLITNLDSFKSTKNNTSVWYDVSKNQYQFNLNNSPTYTVLSSSSYYTFNGTNQYALATSNYADSLGEMTVTAWIRTTTPYVARFFTIVGKTDNNEFGAGWGMTLWPGVDAAHLVLAFQTQNLGGANYTFFYQNNTSLPLNDGAWHYVAVTLTGGINGTASLYRDGIPLTVTDSSVRPVTNDSTSSHVSIGATSLGTEGLPGDIADVQIYNRALSASEILNNYNADSARYGLSPTSAVPVKREDSATIYASSFDEISIRLGSLQCNATGGADAFINTPVPAAGMFSFPGAFTVECFIYWINRRTGSNEHFIGVLQTGGFVIAHYANGFIGPATYPVTGVGNMLYNTGFGTTIPWNTLQWYHLAVTRDSSNFLRMWINGVQAGPGVTYAGSFTSGVFSAGSDYNGGTGNGANIYLSNLRVVNGAAVYNAPFSYPNKVLNPSYPGTILALNMYSNNTWPRDSSPNYYVMTTTGVVTWVTNGAFNQGNLSLKQRQLADGTLQTYWFDEKTGIT